MKADEEIVHISVEEAVAAVRAAAFTEQYDDEPERQRIHTFTTGGFAIGADWDLSAAEDFVERSEDRAWRWDMFRHELAVLCDGRVIAFDAQRDKHAMNVEGLTT